MYYLFYMGCNYIVLYCGIVIYIVFFFSYLHHDHGVNEIFTNMHDNEMISVLYILLSEGVYAVKPLASVWSAACLSVLHLVT